MENSLFRVNHPEGHIRYLQSQDISDLLKIYAPYVSDSVVSFEMEVPSLDTFIQRIENINLKYPILVFENLEGKVVGYTYFTAYRERAAYQWCVESAIYISDQYFGKGIAKKLYHELFKLAHEIGYTRVYGVIALPNDRSEAFHVKMGFKKFAVFQKTGYKFGKWIDVVWYELELNDSLKVPKDLSLYKK